MKTTSNTKKSAVIFYGIGVFALSIYLLYFYLQQKSILILKDAIYYMAIADGILENGAVLNFATYPASPVVTPQNGVVVFHLILSILGLGHESRLIAIVIFNYLLHLSAIYPLLRIARRLRISDDLSLIALLSLFAGSYYFYYFQLMPLNDGVFNALCVWLTYLIILIYDEAEHQKPIISRWLVKLAVVFTLAVFLVHFRLQTFFVFGAAFLAGMIVWRPRFVRWMMISAVIASVSLVSMYIWIDTSNITKINQTYASSYGLFHHNFFSQLIAKTIYVWNEVLPTILFKAFNFPAKFIYSIFAIAIVLHCVSGIRRREFGVLFISLFCLVSIFGTIVFLKPVVRYLAFLFPFLYLLVMLSKWTRPFGYVLITIVLILSFAKLRFGLSIPESENHKFWRYLCDHRIVLPVENPLFLSEVSQRPYLFLKARSFVGELTWEKIRTHQSLFLVGNRDFLKTRLEAIEHLAQTANHTFRLRNLTPSYQDDEGFQLLELYDFIPKSL